MLLLSLGGAFFAYSNFNYYSSRSAQLSSIADKWTSFNNNSLDINKDALAISEVLAESTGDHSAYSSASLLNRDYKDSNDRQSALNNIRKSYVLIEETHQRLLDNDTANKIYNHYTLLKTENEQLITSINNEIKVYNRKVSAPITLFFNNSKKIEILK